MWLICEAESSVDGNSREVCEVDMRKVGGDGNDGRYVDELPGR